jgi:WD40 repeat protein
MVQHKPRQDGSYKVGGCLAVNHPTYVTRQADQLLLEALRAGHFCYVFNCRQMGKSSLRVRTMYTLQAEGMICASIDLTTLGSLLSPQQWYSGMILQLAQSFQLLPDWNLKSWLQDHDLLSPIQKLSQFIEQVLLPHYPGQRVFIFIDEIDKTLGLNFSTDDFFALIRFFYNQRADNADYERLNFALFGVVTPADLIQDKTQTLFNIGYAVELNGFTEMEAKPLAEGLTRWAERPQAVLQAILAWSGGQPFLTQKLCQKVTSSQTVIAAGQESIAIQQLVQSRVIANWEYQDEPVHLKTIRDRIFSHPRRTGQVLELYQRLLKQGAIACEMIPEHSEIRLSGLVVNQEGYLRVYNPIYQAVFTPEWVAAELEKLRPYAEAIAAWEYSHRQDESRLLRGRSLQDALNWSKRQSLSDQDYQFLAASQALDKQMALEAAHQAQEMERLTTQLEAERKATQKLALAYRTVRKRLWAAAVVLGIALSGSAIAAVWVGYAFQKRQEVQTKALEWAGKSALKQFEFRQIDALLTALEAGQELRATVQPNSSLQDYPTTSPVLALQDILDNIRERNQLEGHQETINSITISPDGKLLATASRDDTAKLWNLQGKELATFSGHRGDVYSISFSPDGKVLATASKDGTAKLWTLSGKAIATFSGHQGDVYGATFSPDGQQLVTASRDRTAKLWTIPGKEIQTLADHQGDVYNATFSPDGAQIATASRDGTVKLWDRQGQLQQTLQGHQGAIYQASFSPTGQTLATASADGTVKLWDKQGKLRKTLRGHQEAVYDVSFSPDGQVLATASDDETFKLWSLKGEELAVFQGDQGAVYDVVFSPTGRFLATASHDKVAHLWDLQRPEAIASKQEGQSMAIAVAISPNGQWLAYASAEGGLFLRDLQTGKQMQFKGRQLALAELNFSPNSEALAVSSKDGRVQVWSVQGTQRIGFPAHSTTIYRTSFSPDGQLLATAARDNTVKLWTMQGKLLRTFSGHREPVYGVSFSPDGKRLATASSDETVKIWDLQGRVLQTLRGHQGPVHDLSFSPDGTRLATASSDDTAKLWDLQGRLLRTLRHSSGLVYRLAFSPNGQWLATGSKDGFVSVWDLQGNLRLEVRGHRGLVNTVRFQSNQQLMTTAGSSTAIRRWPIEASASARLERMLRQGCDWLADYFVSHPQAKLAICRQASVGKGDRKSRR